MYLSKIPRELAAIVVIIAQLGASISPANADGGGHDVAHLTCSPDGTYFAFRTHQYYSSGYEWHNDQSYFSASDLEQSPFECKLTNRTVSVKGLNAVTGKGMCGARQGALVQVLIDGKPISHSFQSFHGPSSTSLLRDGWIELSDCFEYEHNIKILNNEAERPEFLLVELCRLERQDEQPSGGRSLIRGECKMWSGSDATSSFPKMEPIETTR